MNDPVLALIQSKGLSYTVSGKDYLIKCLNPEHEDSNPSLRVDRITGITHCFACNFKRNLFKHFGVFTNNSSIRVAKLKEKLKDLQVGVLDLAVPKGHTPYTQAFRGISTTTLKYFEAFYTHEVEELQDRVIFPIKDVTGKTVVFVGRHALSDGNPRYVNYPRGAQIPCFPLVMHENEKSIVLVEGIFDMLNLYDRGLKNVVCTFGTSTLKNNANSKLLPLKAQGVHKIFLLYDGDTAGREAAKELKPILEGLSFIVEIIDLPDDTDPGNLDQADVDSIKGYISENSDNRQGTV